ncbi:hypothetical protein B296_00042326 [Ensete ventricosum]|uniref:Uncharacterized protein n=1 Tax=Ensete ventricosum TaxID=4639 RepID=A0A426X8Y0_ENSVE|nr:hypothetical protein B296_00042326 [Ensete ventricosum]
MAGGGIVVEETTSSSIKPSLPSRTLYAHNLSHTDDELRSFRSNARHVVVFWSLLLLLGIFVTIACHIVLSYPLPNALTMCEGIREDNVEDDVDENVQEEEEGPGDHCVPSVELVDAHPPEIDALVDSPASEDHNEGKEQQRHAGIMNDVLTNLSTEPNISSGYRLSPVRLESENSGIGCSALDEGPAEGTTASRKSKTMDECESMDYTMSSTPFKSSEAQQNHVGTSQISPQSVFMVRVVRRFQLAQYSD